MHRGERPGKIGIIRRNVDFSSNNVEDWIKNGDFVFDNDPLRDTVNPITKLAYAKKTGKNLYIDAVNKNSTLLFSIPPPQPYYLSLRVKPHIIKDYITVLKNNYPKSFSELPENLVYPELDKFGEHIANDLSSAITTNIFNRLSMYKPNLDQNKLVPDISFAPEATDEYIASTIRFAIKEATTGFYKHKQRNLFKNRLKRALINRYHILSQNDEMKKSAERLLQSENINPTKAKKSNIITSEPIKRMHNPYQHYIFTQPNNHTQYAPISVIDMLNPMKRTGTRYHYGSYGDLEEKYKISRKTRKFGGKLDFNKN